MSQALLAMMGAGSASAPTYVDDVFSTYLYTGNGSTQTINNGIDLAGKGGLVWIKARDGSASSHILTDTAKGTNSQLKSDTTDAATASSTAVTAFNATGFSIATVAQVNSNAVNYVSWTFRKAAKFFDVVTYTGNGLNRTISHNLGQVPGMIIVKRTDTTGSWMVYHRSLANTENLVLNTTAAKATNATAWNSTTADASVFSLGTHADVNTNGGTYVAYLFAHDTASDGLIQCGSYTGNGSATGPQVTLGWEPQYVMVKRASGGTSSWFIFDQSRGFTADKTGNVVLYADLSNAEAASTTVEMNAQGFQTKTASASFNNTGDTYIYLAIRRPNKPPTSGTQVYNAIARTGTGAAATVTGVGFAPDLAVIDRRSGAQGVNGPAFYDRLRGANKGMYSTITYAETTQTDALTAFSMDGCSLGVDGTTASVNWNANVYINWFFKRAPGVFDVVCYTGTGSATTVSHNLGVAPELMIVKNRTAGWNWSVYHTALGNTKHILLDSSGGPVTDSTIWNNTLPTASVFTVGTAGYTNSGTGNYVAYLFATKVGISKVFSYTGNGSNQNIECGFTTGARFVLLKRTDSTGNWLVADTTRGIIAGNDPSLALNSTSAEVTTLDWIDPYSGGFNVVQESTNNANVNNATYIGLAFA